ncbi:non-structural maintenance of chromosome element4 [Lichtheimia corymbifera JMRC:FSU:9682]|uniref:Non-structural maintenance of chromosomes element 4 n=1 Tax=Lichtheimia corymbifera JMRC:FSU:9682 TaxID=1263082 RepID=A0A068RJG2_9FUNG|nr:non-structural maintenance of chromosome element4 [Lichtheimia corymbifera JMRC:FSU:9682]
MHHSDNSENQPVDENEQQFRADLANKIDRTAFDPKQDKEERRRLRKKYRSLIGETEGNKRELAQMGSEGLGSSIDRGNKLFKEVRNPLEAVLDSRFMTLTADIATQRARNANIGNSAFDADEFISKVKRFGTRSNARELDDLDWKRIGHHAAAHSDRVTSIDFMLGPLKTEKKERKTAGRRNIIRMDTNAVRPTQLDETDLQNQENETSANVNEIYRLLNENGPYNYLKFVTNPTSFSQTVENIFYVSFLIRNALAEIDDSTGEPMLSICSPPTEDQIADGVTKSQLIMNMDMALWKEIVYTYNLQSSVIPTRTRSPLAVTGTKWY